MPFFDALHIQECEAYADGRVSDDAATHMMHGILHFIADAVLPFIARLVEALAWPAVLTGVLIWLRKPLADLAVALRTAKVSGMELTFDRGLQAVEHQVEVADLPVADNAKAQSVHVADGRSLSSYLDSIAIVSPRAAISEAWRYVETAMYRALEDSGEPRRLNPREAAHALFRKELLPEDALGVLEQLRRLRNTAVHAGEMDLTAAQAAEYAQLAERLIATIGARKNLP